MSKVKWSFSLILTIFIVGILSTAAFASDPYNLNTVQNGSSGLEVSFTGNIADTNVDYDSTNNKYNAVSFDIVLKDGSNTTNIKKSTTIDTTTGKGSVSFQAGTKDANGNLPSGTDMEFGKVYTVYLYHTDDTTHQTKLSMASAVVINGHNQALPKLGTNDTKMLNSNETGFNNLKKSRDGQSVHGAYQNNTNSCASCHQTHTGSDSRSTKEQALLFKDGVYNTCSACHDGTTGATNSFSPADPNSISGTFDVSQDTAHGSLHQADGSLEISSAPGGNNNPDQTSGSIGASTWGQEFTCTSCHAPHGAGSAGENNLNVDPLGWGGIQYYAAGATKADGTKATKDDTNGKLFKGVIIHDTVPTTKGDPYILVRLTASTADISTDTKNIGYLYSRAGVKDKDQVIQTYRWDGSQYIRDYSLWLRDLGYKKAPLQKANTAFYDSTGNAIDIVKANMTIVWRDGFAFGPDVSNVSKADVSIGIDVETTKDDSSLYNSASASYIPDSGVEMAKYCAACHTDYMTDPATGDPGILAGYSRHITHTTTVNGQQVTIQGVSDELTCVRCHFAHGTKNAIMKDATSGSNTTTSTDTLSDTNHSSALRRYIDMDSCYSSDCHNKTIGSSKELEWSY